MEEGGRDERERGKKITGDVLFGFVVEVEEDEKDKEEEVKGDCSKRRLRIS